MATLLVADDESRIVDLIEKYALHAGHTVLKAYNGEQALMLFHEQSPDLMILDVMMPELDGFSVCRDIREVSSVPIILLTARGEEYDRIRGFELGIDDYVVKPFSPRELMLRVDAVLKRVQPTVEADVYQHEGLLVNFAAHIVEVDGERVELPPKERELLFFLIRNRNIALSREKLITRVWGYDYYGDDRTLDTHVKLLRKRIKKYSHMIVTVRGVGYRFES